MLIVLVGVRGAGKTTLLNSLKQRAPGATVLQPSTTRSPRNEADNEYDYQQIWRSELYAWEITVGTAKYGMRSTEVEKARSGRCITVFEPLSIDVLTRFTRDSSGIDVITVGLDTIMTSERQQQRVNHDPQRVMTPDVFERAREIVSKCDLVLSGNAEQILRAIEAMIRLLDSRGGMLVKSDIAPLIAAGSLLVGADPDHIRPASYDLRVGDQVWCQGQIITLSDENPSFEIPAYSYAIVSAREIARLPPFVTGRFDLKVSLFFDGVILSNGPQIDPGYKGALFCMLFNGNSRQRGMTRGAHFSTIEFSTTTHLTEGYKQEYQFLERLEKFMHENAIRSPGGTIMTIMDRKIANLDERVKNYESSFWSKLGVLGAAIAIPAAILYTFLWDRVKQAEDIVNEMRETQQSAAAEIAKQREAAEQPIQEAKDRAISEMTRRPRQRPTR